MSNEEIGLKLRCLGAVFRETRTRKRITQGELSQRTGISRNTISVLENGHSGITISTIFVLAKGLRVRAWSIVRLAERSAAAKLGQTDK